MHPLRSPLFAVAAAILLTVSPALAQDRGSVTPVLSIGSFDGPDAFGSITGIAVRESGEILVLDRMEGSVRVFDGDGTLVTTFGTKGQGPGELSELALGVYLLHDGGIMIPDPQNQRVSVFDEAYSFSHSYPLAMLSMAFRWGVLGDIVLKQVRPLPSMPNMPAMPDAPTEAGLMAVDAEGNELGMRVTFDLPDVARISSSGTISTELFAETAVWTVIDASFLVTGRSGRYALEIQNEAGEVVGRIERSVRRGLVNDDVKEEMLTAWEEQMASMELPPQAKAMMAPPTFADSLPVIGTLFPGPEGTLLVARARGLIDAYSDAYANRSEEDQVTVYDVHTLDGRYLGLLELPPRFTPHAVSGSRIYGVARDEYDVETVAVYEVTLPGSL